jgi:hypothetical protein
MEPELVQVHVTSVPVAEVFDSAGYAFGRTPLTIQTEKGSRRTLLLSKDGYVTQTRTVSPMADLDLHLTLDPVRRVAVDELEAHSNAPASDGGQLRRAPATTAPVLKNTPFE